MIKNLAAKIRKTINKNGRELLTEIIRRTGGKIEVGEWTNSPDSLVIKSPRNYTIIVSEFLPYHSVNYWMAHDIGHYCLHFRKEKVEYPITYSRYGTTQEDRVANSFAVELLIPDDEFIEKYKEYKGRLGQCNHKYLLSGYFGVPLWVIENKKDKLGLV